MKTLRVLSFCVIVSFCFSCNFQRTETANTSINLQVSEQENEFPKSTPISESDLKKREVIQKQMLRGENLHDGSIELSHIGDINSVPALLMVLKEYPPNSSGVMACSALHALEALEKITGKKVGIKYEQWNSWWIKYQKTQKTDSK